MKVKKTSNSPLRYNITAETKEDTILLNYIAIICKVKVPKRLHSIGEYA